MRPTSSLRVPVVTFLSRSPSSSRQTLEVLRRLANLSPVPSLPLETRDVLDHAVFSSSLLSNWRFHSVASLCPVSTTVLHFLSLSNGSGIDDSDQFANDDDTNSNTAPNQLTLMSITGDTDTDNAIKSVLESREILSNHMRSGGGTLLGMKLAMHTKSTRYPVEASHLIDELPILDLPSTAAPKDETRIGNAGTANKESEDSKPKQCYQLREVVLPHYFDTSVQSQLSASALDRPKVGLYRWPTDDAGVVIRPLPSAAEDRDLPPPSMVFQCPGDLGVATESLQEKMNDNGNLVGRTAYGTEFSKVGFSGDGRGGQYMVRNAYLRGLDVRLCDSTELSSSFAESQEALMAASLDELQSANVLVEGGRKEMSGTSSTKGKDRGGGTSDAMNGLGDCWVEFRANAKAPGGFFGKRGAGGRVGNRAAGVSAGKNRVAKVPDLPYE